MVTVRPGLGRTLGECPIAANRVGNPHESRTDVKRRTPKHSAQQVDGATGQDTGESRTLGRRGLLTHGGAMVVGAAAAGAAVAATSSPASAATGGAVLQGTVNSVGTDQPATEIDATNNVPATPTLILSNTGSPGTDPATGLKMASPQLRINPAASTLVIPPTTTVGGDIVATGDGNLWFTHAFPAVGTIPAAVFPAIVHTDVNSNSFAPLLAPVRLLDSRNTAGRAHILDASGNLDSTGRLIAGHTIHIDLTSLVFFGDAVTANLTVTGPLGGGFLTIWSGTVALPNASSINYATGQTIANLSSVGIGEFKTSTTTVTDTVAIHCADHNTHVILDVTGFFVREFVQITQANLLAAMRSPSTARAQSIMQARARFKA